MCKLRTKSRMAAYAASFAALIGLGVVLASCDGFLDEMPRGALSGEVLATRQGINTLLVGAYAGLSPAGGGWGHDGGSIVGDALWEAAPDNWVYGTVMSGEAKKGTDAGDQPAINPLMRGEPAPTSGYLNTMWRVRYESVARTNEVLRVLRLVPEGELTVAERQNIEGQARFLRGHFYFELRRMYHRVPWIDEDTEDFNQPNDRDIWPDIENDFRLAFDLLPATQPLAGQANRWAAASYLAKTFLYQEKWNDAKTWFDRVINEGQTTNGLAYGLVDEYHDNFNPLNQHNREVVFAIQFTGEDGMGGIANSNLGAMLNYPYNSPFRCCGFLQPSQDFVNAFQTVDGLPRRLGEHNQSAVTHDQGIGSTEQFTPHQGTLDPRLDWTTGRRGVPYLDWGPHPGRRWIRDQTYAGPYAPKKHVWRQTNPEFENAGSWAPGSAVNYAVIRFADVLLMAAETEAQLNNTARAMDLVNMVRNRAANPAGFVNNAENATFAAAVVDSEAEMLASGAVPNEWVVRTDRNSTFVLLSGSPSDINNWNEYVEPNYEIAQYSGSWTREQALEAIYMERKLELGMEGHRMYDLLRWGIAQQRLNQYFAYQGDLSASHGTVDVAGAQFRFGGPYFPIPQRQLDLSLGQLTQNPGY